MRLSHAPWFTVVTVSTLTLGACSENGFNSTFEPPADRPIIEFFPPEGVVFGEAADGEEIIKEFELRNVGTAALDVTDLAIRSDNPSYRVLDTSAFSLLPEESTTVQVAFIPKQANEVWGAVDVSSNDTVTGTLAVPLLGTGLVPELEINPWTHNFGNPTIGCVESKMVTLANIGTEDLIITDFDFSADQTLSISGSPGLPLTLTPGDSTDVEISFAPEAEVKNSSTITVWSNDPRGALDADQVGEGAYGDPLSDAFEMPEAPPVDILFAVDQSGSMYEDAGRLAQNFGKFIDQVDAVTTDWQVGVVTKNNGCLNYGPMNRYTSDYKNKFRTAVTMSDSNQSGGGGLTEALLSLAKLAMEKSYGGCNDGFLRDDAATHLILVSDEKEQSSASWSTLVEQLKNLHPTNRELVTISAVAGDYPGGCRSSDGEWNEEGKGYYQAVQATGGEFLSICDTDWASKADKLAEASLKDLARFTLTGAPAEETLEVYVDGKLWTSGYHAEGDELVFDRIPPEGADIQVSYNELGCQ